MILYDMLQYDIYDKMCYDNKTESLSWDFGYKHVIVLATLSRVERKIFSLMMLFLLKTFCKFPLW